MNGLKTILATAATWVVLATPSTAWAYTLLGGETLPVRDTAIDVGLGYLRLGQSATTLSGGEAQRVKLAVGLMERPGEHGRVYILDEPTTGLHLADVAKLVTVLDRLVENGHTVIVVEHHLDVIRHADWVLDLGPEAGAAGGELLVAGPPSVVIDTPRSHTGRALAAG